MELLEKEFERPQRKDRWFATNNIDWHSMEWEVIMIDP